MNQNDKNISARKDKKRKAEAARFRLLPVVIFFCVLMLSLRVGVVWRNIVIPSSAEKKEAALSITAVQAQDPVPVQVSQ